MRPLLVLAVLWPGVALADAIPGDFVPDPGRPGWRGGPPPDAQVWDAGLDPYDPPMTTAPPPPLVWKGAPAGWVPPVTALSSWQGTPAGWVRSATVLSSWRGAPTGWVAPVTGRATPWGPVPPGGSSPPPDGPGPQPPNGGHSPGVPDVPMPALVPGLIVALSYTRRLRRRIRSHV
jgi:hypothetical protein